MTYIEQHSNPEILKLGIKYALYGEKRPDEHDFHRLEDGMPSFEIEEFREACEQWQQSRIAYLKEPEFKVGEIWYWRVTNMRGQKYNPTSDDFGHTKGFELEQIEIAKRFSHYYPGQQVESFKYVREMNFYEFKKVPDDGSKWNEWKNNKWQEAEEPEPMFVGKTKYHEPTYEPNPKYTQFQEDVERGIILAEINT